MASTEMTAKTNHYLKMLMALAALVASLLVASEARPAHAGTTFVVNDSGDKSDDNPGDGFCHAVIDPPVQGCTLRAAIQEANENPGADQINFSLPFTTIAPSSPLPAIRNQTTIDGYTQPGSSPNTLAEGDNAVIGVQLDGRFAGSSSGLVFNRSRTGDNFSNSIVQGLAINNFSGDGITIFGGLGVRIKGNFIGTDTSGTTDQGNGGDGVVIREDIGEPGGAHVVGDGTPASRNVISGNEDDGVDIFRSTNNEVRGNYIGTDSDGTDNLTNDDMGNDGNGVAINQSKDNTIGGSAAGQGNLISSNDFGGISVSRSTGDKVLGNHIGTDRTGTKDLGNFAGVSVRDASNTSIGDGTAGGANTLAFSDRDGVAIGEGGDGIPNNTNGNSVSRNSIFSNDGKGIVVCQTNDPGDADEGPNRCQNFPVLSSAKTGKKGTTIGGKLDSQPNTAFTVQFFSNPKGTDEGKTFLGQTSVSTDGSGNASFSFKPASKVGKGQSITATATANVPGDTSEFSAPRKVVRQ